MLRQLLLAPLLPLYYLGILWVRLWLYLIALAAVRGVLVQASLLGTLLRLYEKCWGRPFRGSPPARTRTSETAPPASDSLQWWTNRLYTSPKLRIPNRAPVRSPHGASRSNSNGSALPQPAQASGYTLLPLSPLQYLKAGLDNVRMLMEGKPTHRRQQQQAKQERRLTLVRSSPRQRLHLSTVSHNGALFPLASPQAAGAFSPVRIAGHVAVLSTTVKRSPAHDVQLTPPSSPAGVLANLATAPSPGMGASSFLHDAQVTPASVRSSGTRLSAVGFESDDDEDLRADDLGPTRLRLMLPNVGRSAMSAPPSAISGTCRRGFCAPLEIGEFMADVTEPQLWSGGTQRLVAPNAESWPATLPKEAAGHEQGSATGAVGDVQPALGSPGKGEHATAPAAWMPSVLSHASVSALTDQSTVYTTPIADEMGGSRCSNTPLVATDMRSLPGDDDWSFSTPRQQAANGDGEPVVLPTGASAPSAAWPAFPSTGETGVGVRHPHSSPVTPSSTGLARANSTTSMQQGSAASSCTLALSHDFSPHLPLPSASLLTRETPCTGSDTKSPQPRLLAARTDDATPTPKPSTVRQRRSERPMPLSSSNAANAAVMAQLGRGNALGVASDTGSVSGSAAAPTPTNVVHRLAAAATPGSVCCSSIGRPARSTVSTVGRPSIGGSECAAMGSVNRPRYLNPTKSWVLKHG